MKINEFKDLRVCEKCNGILRLRMAVNVENDIRILVYKEALENIDQANDFIWVLRCIQCGHSVTTSEPIRDLVLLSRLFIRWHCDMLDDEGDEELVRIMAGDIIITNVFGEPVVPVFDVGDFGVIAFDSKLNITMENAMTTEQLLQREETERMIKLRLVAIVADKNTPPDKVIEKVKPLSEWILRDTQK